MSGRTGGLDVDKLLAAVPGVLPGAIRALDRAVPVSGGRAAVAAAGVLQRIVNGGGRVEREYGLGRKRVDLLLLWPQGGRCGSSWWSASLLRDGLETTLRKGLAQTAGYMDRCGAEAGHLVVLRPRPGQALGGRRSGAARKRRQTAGASPSGACERPAALTGSRAGATHRRDRAAVPGRKRRSPSARRRRGPTLAGERPRLPSLLRAPGPGVTAAAPFPPRTSPPPAGTHPPPGRPPRPARRRAAGRGCGRPDCRWPESRGRRALRGRGERASAGVAAAPGGVIGRCRGVPPYTRKAPGSEDPGGP